MAVKPDIIILILILKAFLVRPLQEGHVCITILVNPSYKIQLWNVKHTIKRVSFKKFSKVGDVGFSANVFGESVSCGRTSVQFHNIYTQFGIGWTR